MPDAQAPEVSHIVVEFESRPGLQQVALSPDDIARKSAQAVDRAMETVRDMAGRVTTTLGALAEPPSQVAVEFGIKLDVEAGALIAKAGGEASITVKLAWDKAQDA
jgi:hypothetical protein